MSQKLGSEVTRVNRLGPGASHHDTNDLDYLQKMEKTEQKEKKCFKHLRSNIGINELKQKTLWTFVSCDNRSGAF